MFKRIFIFTNNDDPTFGNEAVRANAMQKQKVCYALRSLIYRALLQLWCPRIAGSQRLGNRL